MSSHWGIIASTAANAATNMVEGFANLSKQRRHRINEENWGYAQRAADYNYYLDQQSADAAHQRQIDLFNRQANYNDPSQQVARLRAAGLNPALAFQNGGGGMGVSMPSAQGKQGGTAQAPSGRQMPVSFTSGIDIMSIQTARAQQDLIRAQAENVRADTKSKLGETEASKVEIENKRAQTASLLEQIENSKVQRIGYAIENDMQRLQLELAQATQDINIQSAHMNLKYAALGIDKLLTETSILKTEDEIKRQTMYDVIMTQNQQLKNLTIDYVLKSVEVRAKEMGIILSYEQAERLTQQTALDWSRYYADLDQTKIENALKERGQEFTMWGTINRIIDDVESTIDNWVFDGKTWHEHRRKIIKNSYK